VLLWQRLGRAVGGADVILGASNSVDPMADSITGLRPYGRLVLVRFGNRTLAVHADDLMMRRIRIQPDMNANGAQHVYDLDSGHPPDPSGASPAFEKDAIEADFLRQYSLDPRAALGGITSMM
jgi:hypothetical protein